MKKTRFLKYCIKMSWVCVLLAMTLGFLGCMGAQGLTANEVDQRHRRAFKSNTLSIQDDIDAVGMIDRPLRLNEQTIR